MKILFIPSWYPPDGGWSFRDMAIGLLNRGHKVAILYAKPISVKKRPDLLLWRDLSISCEDGLTVYRCTYPVIPRLTIAAPLFYANACKSVFLKYMKEHGVPDIVNANSSVWAGYAAAHIKKEFNVPYVISEHRGRFTLFTKEARALIKWWFPFYLKTAFHHVDGVRLVGSLLLNGLGRYRTEKARWEIISNGIDTAFFTTFENKDDSCFTIVSVGGLNHGKGMDILLASYLQLHTKYKNSQLIIAGDGRERTKLQQFVSDNNLNDSVTFTGQMDRNGVRNLLRNAHLFVLPTRYEAQGVVYLEAMSCGLPIIGTEATPPEICPPFAGIRVPIDDIVSLKNAMEHVYKNYADFNRMQIREFAVTEHDRKVVTDKIIALYNTILSGAK